MANGNGNGPGSALSDGFWRDMPWWVKAVAIVGVPSLISIGVIVSDRAQLAGTVRTTEERLQRVEQTQIMHDSRVWLRFDELGAAARETNRILMAGCVNDAKTMEARERCIGR